MDESLRKAISDRHAVLERVRQVLIRGLLVRRDSREIDPDTPLFGTGLGLDSVDAVELLVCLETEFGVDILADGGIDPAWMRTVNTVVDLITKLCADEDPA